MERVYGAAEFKAHCLQLLDEVAQSGVPVRISKRGRAMARLVPDVAAEPPVAYGFLAGTVQAKDDLLDTGESWNAESE